MWNTVHPRTRFQLCIANAVGIDGLALCVGKQKIADLVFICVLLKCFYRIIADADDRKARIFELFEICLQLPQLLFTKRSPGSRAEEYDRNRAFSDKIIRRNILIVLIFQIKSRCFCADFGPPQSAAPAFGAMMNSATIAMNADNHPPNSVACCFSMKSFFHRFKYSPCGYRILSKSTILKSACQYYKTRLNMLGSVIVPWTSAKLSGDSMDDS